MSTFPSHLVGEWYEPQTGRMFVIAEKSFEFHLIRGFELEGDGDGDGWGKFTIAPYNTPFTWNITWRTMFGQIPSIVLSSDDEDVLLWRRPTDFSYRESLGGVYLEMLQSDVEKLYGRAPIVKGKSLYQTWYYPDTKWAVKFYNGLVSRIAIPKGSYRRFDNSGLNAYNNYLEYKRAYGDNNLNRDDMVRLSKSEFIWFDNSSQWKEFEDTDWIEMNIYGF